MPSQLATLFEDDQLTLVVSGWSGGDRRKFSQTFGWDERDIRCAIQDLQVLARKAGSHKVNLQALARVGVGMGMV